MNFLAISSILIVINNLLMAVFLFFGSRSRRANVTWGYFCLSVVIWGVCCFKAAMALSMDKALFWWQVANISSLFTPVIFCDFVLTYLQKSKRIFIISLYLLAYCFLLLNFFKKEWYIGELTYMFNQFYYIDWTNLRNPLYLFFYIFFYWILLLYSFILLLKHFFKSSGLERNQLKYFIIGMMIGFLGGHLLFLPAFGIKIYPYFNILIAIYPIIIGYAIVRYRLMDVTIAITRTTIFIFVYSLVLGIPFALTLGLKEKLMDIFGENWWMFPLIVSTVLATVGPFIYLFIQKKAEDRLLQEQRQYQATLRQASLGMGQIKELRKLLRLIVNIVVRAVRISHCEIFLSHEASGQYILKATRGFLQKEKEVTYISNNETLIKHLRTSKEPLVFEELKHGINNSNDYSQNKLVSLLEKLNASVVIPSFIEEKMLAIIVLGKKRSGKLYSQDDLVVFSILANQAALAIDNAQVYEEMKKTHEQLFKAEKMATIGTMADGLSHQINNRLHAMGFIAGDALDSLKLIKAADTPEKKQMLMDHVEHALARIEDNVKRGGEIVEGLLKYTRKGDDGFTEVDLGLLVQAALEMVQFKIKLNMITINKEYDENTPKIKGNFTQLQEVFFNLIDNSYDAMMQRKDDFKEPGYSPELDIIAKPNGAKLEILIRDNGIGVKKDDAEKLFTPFFTTKLSSKKGTGLGLYVIQKIVEDNHRGKVKFTSEYKVGSQTSLMLPVM